MSLPLPGMSEPAPELIELAGMSAGRRLTNRQTRDVKAGRHPLTGGNLHDQADTTAHPGDPVGLPYRCGSCTHRVILHHHDHNYPKCDLTAMSHGAATDVRSWWPGCPLWEAAT